jgi:hypothetical protein
MAKRLGISRAKLYEDFIRPGLIDLWQIGPNSVGGREEQVDQIIASLPRAAPGPAVIRKKKKQKPDNTAPPVEPRRRRRR